MATPGEQYLSNDIAAKARLICDLVNDLEQQAKRLNAVEALLTPAQRKKLEPEEAV